MTNETKFTPGPWKVHGLAIYQAEQWKDGNDLGSRFVAQAQDEIYVDSVSRMPYGA